MNRYQLTMKLNGKMIRKVYFAHTLENAMKMMKAEYDKGEIVKAKNLSNIA